MNVRILLAIADVGRAREIADLARETGDAALPQTAVDVGAVTAALGREQVDVVLLHEGIAQLPVMEVVRDLSTSFPSVAFVLLVDTAPEDVLHSALQAGARGVLSRPLTVDDLRESVGSAADWARAARDRVDSEVSERVGGATIAVAGAKGGVGTTTVGIHLALAAAGAGRSTCLVDFDLQAGDVRGLFDLPPRRSVSDLVDVAAEASGTQLREALYRHESGLQMLLAPEEGERAEEIGAAQARGLVGALKFAFEVVVIDLGSLVSEASAVAVELADEAIVVTTPDVPSLRAANRLIGLWKRLQVRDESNAFTLLNRASRRSEVQPELARRILTLPLLETAIPADFRALETAVNTAVPSRIPDGALRSALDALAVELGLAAEPRQRGRRSLLRAEAGQVSAELVGMFALIMTVLLMLWQIALVGYTFVLADHAAREGARAMAVGSDIEDAAIADVPGAWKPSTEIDEGDDEVEVSMDVPALVPGLETPLRIRAREGSVDEG